VFKSNNKENHTMKKAITKSKDVLDSIGPGPHAQKSNFDIFKDPYPNAQLRVNEEIVSGKLNTLIVRKFRGEVLQVIKETQSAEFAEDHWLDRAQTIIKVHMALRYPEKFKHNLDAGTIDRIKLDYPAQLKYLADISDKLEKGMTVKQIAFAIDPAAVLD
jgi:hypothetical protein